MTLPLASRADGGGANLSCAAKSKNGANVPAREAQLLKCADGVMRILRLSSWRTFIACAASLSLLAQRASAQAADALPSACVRAVGPDVTAPAAPVPRAPGESAARSGRAATDTMPIAIRLVAAVSAQEVQFARSPIVCVKLSGAAELDSVHVLARRNLATPVVRGTTYRDVYIAVEVLGRLNADCISARITGTRAADSTAAARCASIGARTDRGAGRPQ
jgi:hypothetical protein